MSVRNAKMGLCGPGRHPIPGIKEYVFPAVVDPQKVTALEEHAKNALKDLDLLNLYVTGLSVALIAVVNACSALGIELILWHYCKEHKCYYPQSVIHGRNNTEYREMVV